MPTRPGYVQLSVQIPEAMHAAIEAKRGGVPWNVAVCEALAKAYGVRYERPPRGAAAHKKKAKPRKGKK